MNVDIGSAKVELDILLSNQLCIENVLQYQIYCLDIHQIDPLSPPLRSLLKNEPIGDGEEGEDLVGHREERACCALHGDGSRMTIGEEDVGVRGGDKRRRPQGAVGFGDTLVERGIRGSARARETSRLGPTSSGGRH